jgi:hypothetical protein
MSHERRQFVYIPDIAPESFLLYFEKKTASTSWSVRDYSARGAVAVHYGTEYGWLSHEALAKAQFAFPAPVVSVSDLNFWHRETVEKNRLYLRAEAPPEEARFPVMDLAELLALPKGRKRDDMRRIYESPRSEDWVTWNFIQLLRTVKPDDWMAHLLAHAPGGASCDFSNCLPSFWKRVAPPRDLDGPTEIEMVLDSPKALAFLEAKLFSDVSGGTKHDPARNQIVRTIDCLLGEAAGREARLWMLVRDAQSRRLYTGLINEYRSNPGTLAQALPHRDPERIQRVAGSLGLILWSDLARPWLYQPASDPLSEKVRRELVRRIDPRGA